MTCLKCGTPKEELKDRILKFQFEEGVILYCGTCAYQKLSSMGIRLNMASQLEPGLKRIRGLFEFDQTLLHSFVKELQVEYDKKEEVTSYKNQKVSSPKEIKSYLDQYVIGQDEAKMALSLAVHRVQLMEKNPNIRKSNIFLVGPTASGKTELGRSIGKYLNRPFIIVDASSLTPSGYVGQNVQSIIRDLYKASGECVDKAENGVIFIDELDKVVGKRSEMCVQSELLKIIEDGEYTFDYGPRAEAQTVTISTKNILFIASGAFHGLYRNEIKKKVGLSEEFNSVNPDRNNITTTDLVKNGVKKELIGRFDTVVCLDKVDIETIKRVITEPKNSILKEYESIFQEMGLTLKLSARDLNEIANEVYHGETGLRGLRSVFSKKLSPYIFQGQSYISTDTLEEGDSMELTA